MQFSRRRSRKKKVVRWLVILGAITLLGLAAPSAYTEGREYYKNWKRDRALRQAKEFFQAKDFAKANTALQVALRTDRQSIAVWKTIADMTEAAGAREAIMHRRQVVLLAPTDTDAGVALAMTALRFGDLLTARDALAAIPQSFRNTVHYRRAVALYAMIEGNGSTAEQVLASLMKTDPSENLRLNYLSVRLSHPDPVVATTARQEIAGMIESPSMAAAALRTLMTDAIFRKDFPAAKGWLERLLKQPGAVYTDELALGTLALLVDKKNIAEVLPPLEAVAGDDPAKLAELSRWLLVQGETEKVAAMIDGLSPELKDSFALKPLRVELAMRRQDWPVVGELLRQGALGPVPPEAIRVAMAARTIGELQGKAARFAHWGKAIDLTRTNIFGLRVLYQLGVAWKWGREVEATLQAIAAGFAGQTWAHDALVRVYTAEKNGPGLQKIFALWSQQSPGVTRLKHDSVLMDLLVFGTRASAGAKKAAEEIHKNEPANPFYATTCALAYTWDGRSADAFAVVSKLPAAERSVPARAPYLAFIYAKAKKADLVRAQLALVRTETLLIEELALVEQSKVILAELDAEQREINRLIGETPSAPLSVIKR